MKIKRSIEIFVETHRRFVISQADAAAQKNCPTCGETMLAAEHSAKFFQINSRRIYRMIETGAAHFIETETGAAFVCLASLEEALRRDLPEQTDDANEI